MKTIDDVLAERLFTTDSGKIIRVIIGRPEEYSKGDYLCKYQIQGFGTGEIQETWGSDSAQALIFAFQKSAAILHTSKEGMEKSIKWIGSEGRDMIGFPIMESLLDLVGYKLIDDKWY